MTTDTTLARRPSWFAHPVQTWRALLAAHADRADAEARAPGLTVEMLPGGVRRYREPRLDSLIEHRTTTAGQDWSPVRLVEAGQARTPAAPETTGDRRTEHGGLSPGWGRGLPAPTAPSQGRIRAACGGPPKGRVAP